MHFDIALLSTSLAMRLQITSDLSHYCHYDMYFIPHHRLRIVVAVDMLSQNLSNSSWPTPEDFLLERWTPVMITLLRVT